MKNTTGRRLLTRHLAGKGVWFFLSSLLLLYCLPGFAIGQTVAKTTPARVEAAFLRNFAHYITWPSHAFADEKAAWRICVLGNDTFGEILENTLKGSVEQGRGFE